MTGLAWSVGVRLGNHLRTRYRFVSHTQFVFSFFLLVSSSRLAASKFKRAQSLQQAGLRTTNFFADRFRFVARAPILAAILRASMFGISNLFAQILLC